MIKVEHTDHGVDLRIEGTGTDISSDLSTIFEALAKDKRTELLLLACIDNYLTSRVKETLNKKGESKND